MALRLSEKAPKGASASVAKPVMVKIPEMGSPASPPLARSSPKPQAWMAATPGMFCEAMVTTNSGSAKLTMAETENCGAT